MVGTVRRFASRDKKIEKDKMNWVCVTTRMEKLGKGHRWRRICPRDL